jgi:hypothetical protein
MQRRIFLSFPVLSAALAFAPCPVRCQEVSAEAKQIAAANAVSKPTRKPDQVATNDPIALLAVRRSGAEPTPGEGLQDRDSSGGSEAARKAVEIASVEQQIKDKQKRIVLLMRLFVEDERAFVNDPSNANVEATVVERRRYEQDELHWETAELARLKAVRARLTASR